MHLVAAVASSLLASLIAHLNDGLLLLHNRLHRFTSAISANHFIVLSAFKRVNLAGVLNADVSGPQSGCRVILML